MRFSGAIIVKLILLHLSGGFGGAEEPSTPKSPERQSWQRAMELGELAFARGDYSQALEKFLVADQVEFLDIPNYEALPRIADVSCRLGDYATGEAILVDLRCIVDVELGLAPCYVGEETHRGDPGHPNPELTPVCFERMCSEIFLAYYESPSDAQVAKISALRRELERVDAICRGEPVK